MRTCVRLATPLIYIYDISTCMVVGHLHKPYHCSTMVRKVLMPHNYRACLCAYNRSPVEKPEIEKVPSQGEKT